jgi:hypothetical protein
MIKKRGTWDVAIKPVMGIANIMSIESLGIHWVNNTQVGYLPSNVPLHQGRILTATSPNMTLVSWENYPKFSFISGL